MNQPVHSKITPGEHKKGWKELQDDISTLERAIAIIRKVLTKKLDEKTNL